jgi:hypothetical protein
MKHTFASSSRPSASHPLVILSSWIVKSKPARNIYNVVYFCAKGNTHQYWPFPARIFCSKGGSFLECRLFSVYPMPVTLVLVFNDQFQY